MRSVCVLSSVITALLLILGVAPGCAPRQPAGRAFEFRGQILEVRSGTELLIKHDEIRGFMPAMTMPYNVRDASLVQGKTAGDLVAGTLVVTDTDAWIAALSTTGRLPIADPVPVPSPAARVRLLRPGDPAPDTPLTGDDGQVISFAAWRGAAVAITFIYTRCPLPQFCPMMDRRFAEVQRLAAAHPELKGRARLLSVSFDPDADTPALLRAHAQKLGADPAIWRFATAPREVVDVFAAAFGVNVIREQDRSITHNLRTAVVDPGGRVVSIYDGGEWTAQQVVDDLRKALGR